MNRALIGGAVVVAASIATVALAQVTLPAPPSYDIRKETTIRGTVAEVKTIPDWMGQRGVNIMLKVEDGTIVHVDTAPEEFLKFLDFSVAPGDLLEVTGLWSKMGGDPVFLARVLHKQKTTISLRNGEGQTVW